MFEKTPRNDRPVDIGPSSDVDRRDVIRWASVAAADTPEAIPVGTISPLVDPADGADVARPPWRDGHYLNPIEQGLVFDELSELVESPGVEATTLRPSNRHPASDTPEVFKGYPAAGVFGLSHQPLGDCMVNVPVETGFFSGELSEMPLRAPRSAALECRPQLGVFLSHFIDFSAGVALTIAVVGEVL